MTRDPYISIKNTERMVRMRRCLTEVFVPEALEIIDDSHRHIGHVGARDGRGHFTVRLISAAFVGLTSLERHRAIYAALGEILTNEIHALSIHASVPEGM